MLRHRPCKILLFFIIKGTQKRVEIVHWDWGERHRQRISLSLCEEEEEEKEEKEEKEKDEAGRRPEHREG